MRKLFLDFDKIQSKNHFDEIALHLFEYQYQNNSIYKSYCNLLNTDPTKVNNVNEIPFLPINFFKSHDNITSHKIYTDPISLGPSPGQSIFHENPSNNFGSHSIFNY